jgi:hypothetical protein
MVETWVTRDVLYILRLWVLVCMYIVMCSVTGWTHGSRVNHDIDI